LFNNREFECIGAGEAAEKADLDGAEFVSEFVDRERGLGIETMAGGVPAGAGLTLRGFGAAGTCSVGAGGGDS
jgi:hypothetical protein